MRVVLVGRNGGVPLDEISYITSPLIKECSVLVYRGRGDGQKFPILFNRYGAGPPRLRDQS